MSHLARKYTCFWLVVAFFLFGYSRAQTCDFNPKMQSALRSITELRYQDLNRLLQEERQLNRDNRAADYLEAAALCIKLFVEEDELLYLQSEPRLTYLVERLADLDKGDPYRNLLMGELYLAKASLQGKFQNNISAAWLFYRAYNLLGENYERFPNFAPNYVPWGVLNAAIGSLPSEYRSIASFLGFEGDIDFGLALVRQGYYSCLAQPALRFYQPYFGFVYAYVNFQLQGNESVSLSSLGLDIQKSSFFIYLESRRLLESGQAQLALDLLQGRPQGDGYLSFPYLDYFTGKIAMSFDLDLARFYFQKFLNNQGNANYVKSTYRYLAWIAVLRNNKEELELFSKKIREEGDTYAGADRQALEELSKGFNTVLIQARLDFDAGNFPAVIAVLSNKAFGQFCDEPWEKQEFYYRKGRAYQELALDQRAIDSFKEAVEVKNTRPSYAHGNSLLQLGMIFTRRGSLQEARYWFEKTLDLKGYPFYEGIHQKALAGLDQLPE